MIWKLFFNTNNDNNNKNIILLSHFNGHCQKRPARSQRKGGGGYWEKEQRVEETYCWRQIEEWAQARAQYGKHR